MKTILLLTTMFAANGAWAHGEDKPGPNGGMIRMPGNFHVEAVIKSEGVEIFLLDINFKDPTVADSQVKAKHVTTASTTDLNCARRQKSFFCSFPKKEMSRLGKLVIESRRAGQAASMDAIYDLGTKAEHSTHH